MNFLTWINAEIFVLDEVLSIGEISGIIIAVLTVVIILVALEVKWSTKKTYTYNTAAARLRNLHGEKEEEIKSKLPLSRHLSINL